MNLIKIWQLIQGVNLADEHEIPVSEGNGIGQTKRYSIAQLKLFLLTFLTEQIALITKGDQGDRGFTGDKGEKGDKGDQGDRGDKGDQGLKGDVGAKGEIGIKGAKGDKGEKGDTGQQGVQGIKGETGEAGQSGFLMRPDPLIVLAEDQIDGIFTVEWNEYYKSLYGKYGHFEVEMNNSYQQVPINITKDEDGFPSSYEFELSGIESLIYII